MEIWIVLLIIGVFIFLTNQKQSDQNKNKNPNSNSNGVEMPTKNRLLSVLNNITGFKATRIIESKQAFYIFAIDEKIQKLAFVSSDLAVTIIPIQDIISYEIAITNRPATSTNVVGYNTKIQLNIKRKHFNNPLVVIECFNSEKLANRAVAPIKNQLMLKAIYDDELAQCNLICQTIKDFVTNSTKQKALSPQAKTEKIKTEPVINIAQTPSIPKETKIITQEPQETKQEEPIYQPIILDEQEINIPTNTPIDEIEINNYPIENEEEIATPIPIDLKKISLSEIENITRGTFINNDLLSLINNARMRGESDVFLTEEQFSELTKNTTISYDQVIGEEHNPNLTYRPINYQTNYKEEFK